MSVPLALGLVVIGLVTAAAFTIVLLDARVPGFQGLRMVPVRLRARRVLARDERRR